MSYFAIINETFDQFKVITGGQIRLSVKKLVLSQLTVKIKGYVWISNLGYKL